MVSRGWGWEESVIGKEHEEIWGIIEPFCILVVGGGCMTVCAC